MIIPVLYDQRLSINQPSCHSEYNRSRTRPQTSASRAPVVSFQKYKSPSDDKPSLQSPPLFSNDFDPSALLSVQPPLSNAMNYGEDITNTSSCGLSNLCPTIELPLDEILSNVDPVGDYLSSLIAQN